MSNSDGSRCCRTMTRESMQNELDDPGLPRLSRAARESLGRNSLGA